MNNFSFKVFLRLYYYMYDPLNITALLLWFNYSKDVGSFIHRAKLILLSLLIVSQFDGPFVLSMWQFIPKIGLILFILWFYNSKDHVLFDLFCGSMVRMIMIYLLSSNDLVLFLVH